MLRYEIRATDQTPGVPSHLRTVSRSLVRSSALDAIDAATYLKNIGIYTDVEIFRDNTHFTEPLRHWRFLPTVSDPFKSYWKSLL
jgi:hypothetical protein